MLGKNQIVISFLYIIKWHKTEVFNLFSSRATKLNSGMSGAIILKGQKKKKKKNKQLNSQGKNHNLIIRHQLQKIEYQV